MRKIAVVFAGQGAQYPGMGKDFYEHSRRAKALFDRANELVSFDLHHCCFEDNILLNDTRYSQPSILVTSLSIYEAMKERLHADIDAFLGFSLGEYSALYAAGVFELDQIIGLIQHRATFMAEASERTKGSMAAILGMKREDLQALCETINKDIGLVRVANFNSPGQLVVSGVTEAVYATCEKAKTLGARRAIPLNVSGGFHTPLMAEAAEQMRKTLEKTPSKNPEVPIVMNCDAQYLKDVDFLIEKMVQQIQGPVYFEDSIRTLIESGIDVFIEIGPGQVLGGLIRKIDGSKTVFSIDKITDLDTLVEWMGGSNYESNE